MASIHATLTIPEDGFDDDLLGSCDVYANWIVSKTFLELDSDGKDSQRIRKCKTDSMVTFRGSTMLGFSLTLTETDVSVCHSNSSTREPSVEDAAIRKRCVTFGDEEAIQLVDVDVKHECQADARAHSPCVIQIPTLEADGSPTRRDRARSDSTTPRMVRIRSLTTDFGAMYRGRLRTDSRCADIFCMSSEETAQHGATDSEELDKESIFGSTLSVTKDYSPRRWRTQTEDDRIEAMSCSKKCNSGDGECADRGDLKMTPAPRASVVEGASHTCTVLSRTRLKTSTPPFVPLGAANTMAWTPYTSIVPKLPSVQSSKFDDIGSNQRVPPEQLQSLFGTSIACSSVPSWAMPAFRTPPGSWGQTKENRRGPAGSSNVRQADVNTQKKTTLVLQNLPNGFSRDSIADLLSSQGFEKKFDFIYVPIKFCTMAPLGYAFVNLVSPEVAEECRWKLDGFSQWGMPCEEILSVIWCAKDQGLKAIIDRHRNSPVMHQSVQEHFKPAIYKNGIQVVFPAPTKRIRPPKEDRYKNKGVSGDAEWEQ